MQLEAAAPLSAFASRSSRLNSLPDLFPQLNREHFEPVYNPILSAHLTSQDPLRSL